MGSPFSPPERDSPPEGKGGRVRGHKGSQSGLIYNCLDLKREFGKAIQTLAAQEPDLPQRPSLLGRGFQDQQPSLLSSVSVWVVGTAGPISPHQVWEVELRTLLPLGVVGQEGSMGKVSGLGKLTILPGSR